MKAARDITEVEDSALKAKENAKVRLKEFSMRRSVGFFSQTSPSTGTEEEERCHRRIYSRDLEKGHLPLWKHLQPICHSRTSTLGVRLRFLGKNRVKSFRKWNDCLVGIRLGKGFCSILV